MAIEIMKTDMVNGSKLSKRNAEIEKRSAAKRFIWNPGSSPVITPRKIPRKIAKNISNIFYFLCNYF